MKPEQTLGTLITANGNADKRRSKSPLADRIRPQNLTEFVGQEHLVGPGKPLRVAIENDQLFSLIFWGPPGSGKTTLARIIANETGAHFVGLSAVSAGKADVTKGVKEAKERLKLYGKRTVLFLDEIHRFNKAQQDSLLPHVEDGTIILIGATTENPSFEVIGPLLSRCRIYTLNRLTPEELKLIVQRALEDVDVEVDDDALEFLVQAANGDARIALNTFEVAVEQAFARPGLANGLTKADIQNVLQSRLLYDRAGEELPPRKTSWPQILPSDRAGF